MFAPFLPSSLTLYGATAANTYQSLFAPFLNSSITTYSPCLAFEAGAGGGETDMGFPLAESPNLTIVGGVLTIPAVGYTYIIETPANIDTIEFSGGAPGECRLITKNLGDYTVTQTGFTGAAQSFSQQSLGAVNGFDMTNTDWPTDWTQPEGMANGTYSKVGNEFHKDGDNSYQWEKSGGVWYFRDRNDDNPEGGDTITVYESVVPADPVDPTVVTLWNRPSINGANDPEENPVFTNITNDPGVDNYDTVLFHFDGTRKTLKVLARGDGTAT